MFGMCVYGSSPTQNASAVPMLDMCVSIWVLPHPHPVQDLREQLGAVSEQLHRLNEKLQFMEQRMGSKRGWLWG